MKLFIQVSLCLLPYYQHLFNPTQVNKITKRAAIMHVWICFIFTQNQSFSSMLSTHCFDYKVSGTLNKLILISMLSLLSFHLFFFLVNHNQQASKVNEIAVFWYILIFYFIYVNLISQLALPSDFGKTKH